MLENDCTCPGLALFFDLDAEFELGVSDGPRDYEMCWVEGPHHPDLVGCYQAQIQAKAITIHAWDVGCAQTPCEGILSESGDSIAATCSEGLLGGTCRLVLAAP